VGDRLWTCARPLLRGTWVNDDDMRVFGTRAIARIVLSYFAVRPCTWAQRANRPPFGAVQVLRLLG